MFGGRGVTRRRMTGAAGILGFVCMLSLIGLDNCMKSDFDFEEITADDLKEAHRLIQDAEDAKESNKLFRQTSTEMYAEWDRHADALQDIIARGAPQLRKLQPMFELMENMNNEVRQKLLQMTDENEQKARKLDEAKELLAILEERQKSQKNEL